MAIMGVLKGWEHSESAIFLIQEMVPIEWCIQFALWLTVQSRVYVCACEASRELKLLLDSFTTSTELLRGFYLLVLALWLCMFGF